MTDYNDARAVAALYIDPRGPYPKLPGVECWGLPERDRVHLALNMIAPDEVWHGGCQTGADSYASEWGASLIKRCVVWPADWDRYGRRAGPKRNGDMVQAGVSARERWCRVELIWFPGGAGTCIAQARGVGLPIVSGEMLAAALERT